VVECARPPRSPLHSHFCWDDTKAAEQYRLWQARELIQVVVHVLPGRSIETRAYVSLRDSRGGENGYRALVDVLSDTDLRRRLLQDALAELRYFEEKYRDLKELAQLFLVSRKLRVALGAK
jgi:hypothetical protein